MRILLGLVRQSPLFVTVVFGLCAFGTYVVDTRLLRPQFVVEIRSDTNATAQLFYDVGRGLNAADSARLPVDGSNTYSTLHFSLPRATITALRFDPLNGPGTFSVRHPRRAVVRPYRRQFSTAIFLLSIKSRPAPTRRPNFTSTTPAANDPMLGSLCDQSRFVLSWATVRTVEPSVPAGYRAPPFYSAARSRATFVSRSLIARRSDQRSRLPSSTAWQWASPPVLTVFWRRQPVFTVPRFRCSPLRRPVRPLPGPPRNSSDEWAYHTPAILYQLYRSAPLDDDDTPLGPDGTSLISNIPVRHFTTLFRPQFWAFFVLPPSYAFAFYWQCKAMLLLTGVFSLLLLLTQSSRIAAFGALWYAFSPHIQWSYPWPSLLPEMIGLFGIVMCSVFYTSVGRRPALLVAAAAACAVAAVDFAMCAYVPHQIPLVWLGVCLCTWWISARWKAIFTRDHALPRIAALSGTWMLVALVMFGFYRDTEATLTIMANTEYPGRRSSSAGGYPLLAMFSHFFSFWEDDRHFPLPQLFGNICESAGFFWLAPVTLFSIHDVEGDAEKKRAYWILTAFGAFLFMWMTFPCALIGAPCSWTSQLGAEPFMSGAGERRAWRSP